MFHLQDYDKLKIVKMGDDLLDRDQLLEAFKSVGVEEVDETVSQVIHLIILISKLFFS